MEVGVRQLRDGLSRYLALVKAGEDITITEHGRPIARIVATRKRLTLDEMIAQGLARPPLRSKAEFDAQDVDEPVKVRGSVSDLIAEQRR